MNDAVNIPIYVWVLMGYIASKIVDAFMQLLLAPLLQKLRGSNSAADPGGSTNPHCVSCKTSIDARFAAMDARADDRIDKLSSRIDEEIRSYR